MASLNFDSMLADLRLGNIVPGSDTYYGMLVTATYAPNKGTHTKRSNVTNECTGTGYSTGGIAITVTPSLDTTNHWDAWTLGSINWPTCTLDVAVRALVVYKHRGGAASADELLFYVDFGSDKACSGGTFTFTPSGAFKITN
jgi:hypothetical protein